MGSFFGKSLNKDIIGVEPFLQTLGKASTLQLLTANC